ncbi:hypothetical protein [Billgrantia kenyensis]|uniref:Uncharacterized protein n=1 Tax=Billgrantia kenyensis TaxID=321266 RepID=A0A7V9W3Q1_9GAMM|nr:hypothetical protein [Halomonas kenyensis]MBA2780498.1 hypothetical protein [Halomonas kenyensis]MCG6663418.1 hypothetical protein [Halomonas kenyensis]
MRLWWMMPGLALLAGCQATPTELPSAEPRPAAECRWEAGDIAPREWVRLALDALEADDFVVRDTDPALGLVSAERTRTIPGYGDRYDGWGSTGVFGGVGLGGGSRGLSTGVMIGFGGPAGSATQDATRLERVSLVADSSWVRVSRDIQVIDWRGELRETRSGSDAGFCDTLRQAMTATAAGGEP